jgi:hypothetical protein
MAIGAVMIASAGVVGSDVGKADMTDPDLEPDGSPPTE